jgi:Mg-chelatase subunit ChlD
MSLADIPWWVGWCSVSDARLVSPQRPFGPTRLGGTLSGFALADAQAMPSLDEAMTFVSALVRVETDTVKSVEYHPHLNCADLASGRIFLDPEVIDSCRCRPGATRTERLDILSGLALHEAAHHQFSSRALCARARRRGELFFQIYNLLDDELIEMQLAEASPGYGDYLRATRHYMFADAYQSLVVRDPSLLAIVAPFVRYPHTLTWEAVAPWIRELDRIRAILTPFPRNERQVYLAASRIHDCIISADGPQPTHALKQFLSTLGHPRLVPSPGDLRRPSPGRGRTSLRGSRGTGSQAEVNSEVTWERAADDRAEYEQDAHAVRPHVVQLRRAMARTRARRDETVHGRRVGQLDRRRLHTLAFGNPHVFQQKLQSSGGLTVVLLVDESGSMEGQKVRAARQVAILFHEALASQREVDLYIYGHSADEPLGTTNIFSYWDPRKRGPGYSLGAIRARGNNRDGVAIAAVASAVLRQARFPRVVFIVISDGSPNADRYRGDEALRHTRHVVRSLRRVHVVHVAIDAASTGQGICDEVCRFTDLPRLVQQMRRLLEGILSRH